MKPLGLLVVVASLATGACAPLLYAPAHGRPHGRMVRAAAARPEPPAGRWDNVIAVPPGTRLAVLLANGDQHAGTFVKAGMQWLRLAVDGTVVELARQDVMRVDVVAGRSAGTGAGEVVAGAAKGAATVGGVMMLVPYLVTGDVWVPPARFWGLGAALGAVGAVQKGKLHSQQRTLYLAPGLLGGS